MGGAGPQAVARAQLLVAAFVEQGVPMELGAPEARGEDALRDGRLDLLVEPAGSLAADPELPPLAVLRRGEARDGLLVRAEHLAEVAARLEERPMEFDPSDPLRALLPGARIAAKGPVRVAQLTAQRPDLAISPWEELPAEVAALDPRWDGLLAEAETLTSAGLGDGIRRLLDPPWLGEVGAGAMWVRGRWIAELRELVLPLEDRSTRVELLAERAMRDALPGALLGVRATARNARLELHAALLDGERLRRVHRSGEATIRGAGRLAAMAVRELVDSNLPVIEERG